MDGPLIAYLDTQVLVRLMQGDRRRIGRKAQALIERADLLVSPMVSLEMEYLFELQCTKLSWRDVHAKLMPEIDFKICDLPFAHVAGIAV